MPSIAQANPVTDATVDKLLGANFLSLALIALVMVVAMFLLFVWMNNRRQGADDRRQDAFLKLLIGDDSPLVQAQKNTAAILEKSESRATERTAAITAQTASIDTLGKKTDTTNELIKDQTGHLDDMGKVFSDHQITTHDTVAILSDKVDSIEATVISNTESIEVLTEQIKTLIAHLEDKSDCADAEERIRKLLEFATKRTTDSQPIVIVTAPASNLIPSDPATGEGGSLPLAS